MNSWEGMRKLLELQRQVSRHKAYFSAVKNLQSWKSSLPDIGFYDGLIKRNIGLASIEYALSTASIQETVRNAVIDPAIFANLRSATEAYEKIFTSTHAIAESISVAKHYQFVVPQIRSLAELFAGLTGKLSQIAEFEDNQDEKDALLRITDQAAAISTDLSAKEYATREDLLKFQQSILSFLKDLFVTKKIAGVSVQLWGAIINILISIVISYMFWRLPPPGATDGVTKNDLYNFKKDLLGDSTRIFRENVIRALAKANFKLREKPVFSSRKFATISKGMEVQVLDSQGSWLYVTYISMEDELPISGWIPRSEVKRKH